MRIIFFKFSFSTLAKNVGSVPFKYFFVHSFFKGFKSGFENHASYQLNCFGNPDFINSGKRRRRGGKKRDFVVSVFKGIHSTQPHWHILLCSVCIQSTKIDFSDDFLFSWSNLPSMVVFRSIIFFAWLKFQSVGCTTCLVVLKVDCATGGRRG